MKCSREQQGFTLIEVLIAMALTVVVASIAYSGLSAVLDSLDQTRQAMSRTSELSKAMRMISRIDRGNRALTFGIDHLPPFARI